MRVFKNLLRNLRGGQVGPVSASVESAPSEPDTDNDPILSVRQIESLVGTTVNEPDLYRLAMRHRSLLRGQSDSHLSSNERLEYLGDSVLGFVVADLLFQKFSDRAEGFLTRLRAKLVNGRHLADSARKLDLGRYIQVGDSLSTSPNIDNDSILADALEALIGALYRDRGLGEARRFIREVVLSDQDLSKLARRKDNYKSALLEYLQARSRQQPRYRVISETGPSHNKRFEVGVYLDGEEYGRGEAKSKKRAEQSAAQVALLRLKSDDQK